MRIMNQSIRRSNRRAAFTLMEVLVVVAILVVLAGVGGVIFLRVQEDQYRKLAGTQLKALTAAAMSYASSHGDELPETLAELVAPSDGGRPYLEQKALLDPWNRPYQYNREGQNNAAKGQPDIWSTGPNPNDPSGMIGNW
ncbi:type II secretion system protein GspG [Tuwongella immobilis]|uniref:Type II secretion system protein GspG C-terminal domain-containing protein n=1 Tax=Tuwongella immobilis TaxID=692036 RepID=A0A6C2YTQ1_9BACT|nr:type II secretion system protein GspG [Tuwongella immobilis]VIP04409.1 General secretion pathway protein G OS=Pirellula staleyi (strain ATCC 27377 / DSM 6068 / ICPB 4128) GN=Psta_3671 PE=4 SV=1: T2SG [Tuwongella immobilis]VTS06180.1 General secretion pathway protein G OS=Pirellula staleyi (strain ATCC 27377 / DSM 6068 / ICPB 4128) GN=Psta_3671 PE=4 SV=1: T2SG [Tuwongella immobilis]